MVTMATMATMAVTNGARNNEDETRTDKATEAKVTDGNGESSRAQLSRRRNGVGELAGGMVQGSISLLGGSSGNEHREDGWRTPAQKAHRGR